MEPGMTDKQFLAFLRMFGGNLESVKEYVEQGRRKDAVRKLDRLIDDFETVLEYES